jgi:hypothetical protein
LCIVSARVEAKIHGTTPGWKQILFLIFHGYSISLFVWSDRVIRLHKLKRTSFSCQCETRAKVGAGSGLRKDDRSRCVRSSLISAKKGRGEKCMRGKMKSKLILDDFPPAIPKPGLFQ